MRQTTDAHIFHGDDVWRSSGSSGAALLATDDSLQGRIGRAQDNTNSQSATHEEETESPVNSLESVLDIDTRTFGFGSDHRQVFGTSDTEGCRPESCKETLEFAERSCASVLLEGVVLPVAESVCIVLGVATNHGDEGEGEDDEDQDDFATREPEFSFSEDLYGKSVEDTGRLSQQKDKQRVVLEVQSLQ